MKIITSCVLILSICGASTLLANERNKFNSNSNYSWNFSTPSETAIKLQKANSLPRNAGHTGKHSSGGVRAVGNGSGGAATAIGNNITVNIAVSGEGNSVSLAENAINFDGANMVNNDSTISAASEVIESYEDNSVSNVKKHVHAEGNFDVDIVIDNSSTDLRKLPDGHNKVPAAPVK